MALKLRSRGYLPHYEKPGHTYFVTFRLAGSLPNIVLESWILQRKDIIETARMMNRPLSEHEERRLQVLNSEKVEAYLDKGEGDCWLGQTAVAQLVVDALKHFDGIRYHLIAWCVMPNHVHVVVTPEGLSLAKVLHSWKSFTAHEANKLLSRQGDFWQREYYDHLIRNEKELQHYINYTLENPVAAGLCKNQPDWPWSGCNLKTL